MDSSRASSKHVASPRSYALLSHLTGTKQDPMHAAEAAKMHKEHPFTVVPFHQSLKRPLEQPSQISSCFTGVIRTLLPHLAT